MAVSEYGLPGTVSAVVAGEHEPTLADAPDKVMVHRVVAPDVSVTVPGATP